MPLGIAEFKPLRTTFYLAGLKAENSYLDENALLQTGGEKQMTIKVIADQYSQRRFSIHWSQALIVNSSADALLNFDDALVQFQNIIDEPFAQGDTIVITSSTDGTSRVSLNDELAFDVNKAGFLELLLSTWIGSKPPSTEFKQAILNADSPALAPQFAALDYAPNRSRLIADKRAAQQATEEKAKPVLIAESKPAPAAAVVAPKPVAPPKPKPVVVAKVETPKPVKPVVASAPEEEAEAPIDEALYKEQQRTLRKLYANSSTRHIRSMVNYPSRAQRMGQEGIVKVRVKVDRSGIIESMQITEKSRFKILNNAALKAVEASGKLSAIPPALDDNSLDIVIPFVFRLG